MPRDALATPVSFSDSHSSGPRDGQKAGSLSHPLQGAVRRLWARGRLTLSRGPWSQVGVVSAFAQTLRRYTSLNHLAQAARAVLQNTSQINQMLSDLNRVDFANVQVTPQCRSPGLGPGRRARAARVCPQPNLHPQNAACSKPSTHISAA